MRVSLEWLSQYVNLDGLTPEQIAAALTNSGLEIEEIETLGAKFNGVIVGKILQIEKHPNADKLSLVTVDIKTAQNKVVCGAQNLKQNMLIPYAQVGAQVISRKDNSLFTLGPATIRGVESTGMICSIDELGLLEQYPRPEDGIWPIAEYVKESDLGKPLPEALNLQSDVILHAAIPANRGDLMSMQGIAREVAALFNRETKWDAVTVGSASPEVKGYRIQLDEPDVCGYYAGAYIGNLKIGPSPDWMARRLQAAGVRAINNVVDVTNYVMLEMGQPLHSFDADRLGTGRIGVRRARAGEKLTTLDGVERPLTHDSVVITKDDAPVALAGIMGGEESEIHDATQATFLEAAYFPPAPTRRSGRSVGLRTEGSGRWERGVDRTKVRDCLFRAIQLLEAHANGKLDGFVETGWEAPKKVELSLRMCRIERIVGIAVPVDAAQSILKRLGFEAHPGTNADVLNVLVPPHRHGDVTREIDLVEEVIRIYGYDHVPATLPMKTAAAAETFRAKSLARLRQALMGSGLQEVVTNSLIGPSLLEKTGFSLEESQAMRVTNSHSEDHTVMRQSLLPNLLEIAKFNQAQGNENIAVFELGRTYFKVAPAKPKYSGVTEKLVAAGLLTGDITQGVWQKQAQAPIDFYRLKGLLEAYFSSEQLDSQIRFEPETGNPAFHPGKTARILVGGGKPEVLGVLGQLHPAIADRLKFKHPVFSFELDVDRLLKLLKPSAEKPQPVKISQYQAVERDMAFSLPDTVSHQRILETLAQVNNPLVRSVRLFDEYRGEQLEKGHRSLAYRVTLQSDDTTLTDTQVDEVMQALRASLTQLGVTSR